jgi:hypothetical protein
MCGAAKLPQTAAMPSRPPLRLSEVAITAALLSVYAGARGTARAIGVVQGMAGAAPQR